MTYEIENVKRQKMEVEKSVETLRKNFFSEAIASDGNGDHAVKTALNLTWLWKNWKRSLNFKNDSSHSFDVFARF